MKWDPNWDSNWVKPSSKITENLDKFVKITIFREIRKVEKLRQIRKTRYIQLIQS